jgi:hypothetical protein
LTSDPSYWEALFAQQLTGSAQQGYVECIKQAQTGSRLILWVDSRQSDFFIIGAVWFGKDGQQTGTYDQDPVVAPPTVSLVQKPSHWATGATQQLILQKSPEINALLSIRVSGQTANLGIVRDPPPILIASHEINGSKLTASSFHVSGSVCGAGFAEDCVTPTQPGGFLIRGSGKLKNYSARINSSAGYTVTVDSPERICIKLTVSTGACEARNTGEGVVSAIEQYPSVQP